jgi:hypothetical protein
MQRQTKITIGEIVLTLIIAAEVGIFYWLHKARPFDIE